MSDQQSYPVIPNIAGGVYPKEIAEAITKVMGADLYIQKKGKNAFHGYKYATVGDLLDKLQPLMADAGLVIFQHEMASDLLDNGNVLATKYQFTLAHTTGVVWPEKPVHTGMSRCRDTKGGFDDKAANKCHTAARKYFLLGLFQVPTGEDYREAAHDGDADADGPAPPRNGIDADTLKSRADWNTRKPNGASLPPNPEEPPEIGEDRKRIRALIDRLAERIKAAPDEHRLEVIMDDARAGDLKEIEASGPKGQEAANALRARYNVRISELRGKAA